MSLTKNDRKLQSENGKSFHEEGGYDGPPLVGAIAEALRADFGTAPAAVKRIARLTQANERAARNWIEGKNGPSGIHLVCLMQHSDAVFGRVLELSGRHSASAAIHLRELREHLITAVAVIDAMDQPAS